MILAEEQGKLEVNNTKFFLSNPYPLETSFHFIYFNGSAEARIDNPQFVYVDGSGDTIEAADNSRIHITGTNLTTSQHTGEHSPGSGVVTRDNSNVFVENCSFDVAYCAGDSLVAFLNANVVSVTVYDNSIIHMTDSRIEQLNISGPENAYLTNMFVNQLHAQNSSNIWAKGCHFREVHIGFHAKLLLSQSEAWKVHTYDNGAILFFHDVPLFGRVVFPFSFISYILPLVLTLAIATALLLVYVLRRKRQTSKTLRGSTNKIKSS